MEGGTPDRDHKENTEHGAMFSLAAGQPGPGILRRARFAEEPLTSKERLRTALATRRRQLKATINGPRLPRALKARRTRFVNADPEVAARRADAVAQIANVYPDAIAALRAMEKRLAAGVAATEVARLANVNPAGFGKWYGAARPDASHHHRPDRDALGAALARLAEALDAAGREAARRWPTTTSTRRGDDG